MAHALKKQQPIPHHSLDTLNAIGGDAGQTFEQKWAAEAWAETMRKQGKTVTIHRIVDYPSNKIQPVFSEPEEGKKRARFVGLNIGKGAKKRTVAWLARFCGHSLVN